MTSDGTTLYLHVFNWPKDGKLMVPGLKNKVAKAYLLKSGFMGSHKGLGTVPTGNGAVVSVPATAPDQYSSTVVLDIKGALDIEQQ